MNKLFGAILTLALCFALFGCDSPAQPPAGDGQASPDAGQQAANLQTEKDEVVHLAEEFGRKLQMVSLLAPEDILSASMREHYGEYVTPELLDKWLAAPDQAPGRTVSSPWPDRIVVQSAERQPDGSYLVQGEIIEVTSAEQKESDAAAKRAITLEVKRVDGRWLISGAELGDYADAAKEEGITYINTQYGFVFALPESWQGYKIITDRWEGRKAGDSADEPPAATGPMIVIRHPAWTEAKPRQDIPILVFTISQWEDLRQEKFHLGAAPVGPSELGRNADYVFALPARYNYAFPEGYEEVEEILQKQPLKPIYKVTVTDQ